MSSRQVRVLEVCFREEPACAPLDGVPREPEVRPEVEPRAGLRYGPRDEAHPRDRACGRGVRRLQEEGVRQARGRVRLGGAGEDAALAAAATAAAAARAADDPKRAEKVALGHALFFDKRLSGARRSRVLLVPPERGRHRRSRSARDRLRRQAADAPRAGAVERRLLEERVLLGRPREDARGERQGRVGRSQHGRRARPHQGRGHHRSTRRRRSSRSCRATRSCSRPRSRAPRSRPSTSTARSPSTCARWSATTPRTTSTPPATRPRSASSSSAASTCSTARASASPATRRRSSRRR